MLLALRRGLRHSCDICRSSQHAANYATNIKYRSVNPNEGKPSYTGLATRKSPKAKDNKSGDNGNGNGDAKSKTPESLTPEQWRARRAKNLKLLADLFPSEAKRFRNQAREVPRLPLAQPSAPASPVIRRELVDSDAARSSRRNMKEQGMNSSLLVLRNASKNLTLEDFQRLMPRGKHLEGWTLAVGDIVKVIPGRDLATLERQNYYYILFSSPLSAFTYQTRATKISKLVQSRTPTGLASPMGPGPGELVDGEDVHDLMQSYTLTPPSQQISLRQLAPPLSTVAEQIARCHGYADLVERPNRSPVEVLLRFEGVNPGHTMLNMMIKRAERKRGLPWTGEAHESYKLAKWEHTGEVQSPLSHVRSKGYVLPDNEDAVKDEEGEAKSERKYDIVPRNEYERAEEERISERSRRKPASSFIVGLETQAEASAFVRYWHKRVLMDGTIKNGGSSDAAPIVSAEVLW